MQSKNSPIMISNSLRFHFKLLFMMTYCKMGLRENGFLKSYNENVTDADLDLQTLNEKNPDHNQ